MVNDPTVPQKGISVTFLVSVILSFFSLCVFYLILCGNAYYSFDETYTMALVQYSFKGIWRITSIDVHPPLYYFMLKIFTAVFGSGMTAARVFSLLGIALMFVLGLFPVRRFWGEKVAFAFVLMLAFLPVVQYLAIDIRMYSWSMFFVTAASLSAYWIYTKASVYSYLALTFFALCSAYIHYYAFLGVLVIFGLLFTILIISKRKKDWIWLILFFIIFLAGFSLWIPALTGQIGAVNQHFWITSITAKDILLFTYYTFSPKEPTHPYTIFTLPMMGAALSVMLLFIVAIIIWSVKLFKEEPKRISILTALCFSLVALLPVIFAVIYSYIQAPVIIPRYTTTVLGPLLIAFSIACAQIFTNSTKGKYFITLCFALLALLGITRFFSERKYTQGEAKDDMEMAAYIKAKNLEKTVFMSTLDGAGTLGMFSVNHPGNLFFVYTERENTGTYLPFKLIQVDKLPRDFDFFYVKNNYATQNKISDGEDRFFRTSIQPDFIVVDSLVQKERSIYRFRTVHRERAVQSE